MSVVEVVAAVEEVGTTSFAGSLWSDPEAPAAVCESPPPSVARSSELASPPATPACFSVVSCSRAGGASSAPGGASALVGGVCSVSGGWAGSLAEGGLSAAGGVCSLVGGGSSATGGVCSAVGACSPVGETCSPAGGIVCSEGTLLSAAASAVGASVVLSSVFAPCAWVLAAKSRLASASERTSTSHTTNQGAERPLEGNGVRGFLSSAIMGSLSRLRWLQAHTNLAAPGLDSGAKLLEMITAQRRSVGAPIA